MLQKESQAVYDAAVMKKEATRVSLVNIAGNTALSVFKLLAGILAHSGAMISRLRRFKQLYRHHRRQARRAGARPGSPLRARAL